MDSKESHSENEPIHWYVMSVYAHNMKKAEEALVRRNDLCYFIPKQYVLRTYHGQTRHELVPLISGLLFLYATYEQADEFQKSYPFIGFLKSHSGTGRHTMIVPDVAMKEFMDVARHYEEDLIYYRPEELQLEKGTKVRIVGGVFDGAVGTMLKLKGKREKRLVVSLPGILAVAAAHISPEYIQIITENHKIDKTKIKTNIIN